MKPNACLLLLLLPSLASAQTLIVEAAYPGANAELAAETVAAPLEAVLKGRKGIRRITSVSSTGRCVLWLDLTNKADVHLVRATVQEAIAEQARVLPDLVQRQGVICRVEMPHFEIVSFQSLERDPLLSGFVVNVAQPLLGKLDGVRLSTVGAVSQYTVLWLDKDKLAARKLTIGDVTTVLRENKFVPKAENIGAPPERAGRLVVEGDPAKLESLPLDPDKKLVFLRDVARIEGATRFEHKAGRHDKAGKETPVVLLMIETDGTARTRKALKETLGKIQEKCPRGMRLHHLVPGKADRCVLLRLPMMSSVERTAEAARRTAAKLSKRIGSEILWFAAGNEATLLLSGVDEEAVKAIGKIRTEIVEADLWLGGVRRLINSRPGEGADAVVRLKGKDVGLLSLFEAAQQLRRDIHKEMGNVLIREEPPPYRMPEFSLSIDPKKARELGVEPRDIGLLFDFEIVGSKVWSVHVRVDREELARMEVTTRDGKRVPLARIATVVEREAPREICRVDGEPCIVLGWTLLSGDRMKVLRRIRDVAERTIPKEIKVEIE